MQVTVEVILIGHFGFWAFGGQRMEVESYQYQRGSLITKVRLVYN